jgi:hypothetical protein
VRSQRALCCGGGGEEKMFGKESIVKDKNVLRGVRRRIVLISKGLNRL